MTERTSPDEAGTLRGAEATARSHEAEATRGRPHVMSVDELAAAAPVPATEPEPPEVIALRDEGPSIYVASETPPEVEVERQVPSAAGARPLWRISVRSGRGRGAPGMPVLEADRIDARMLVTEARHLATAAFRPRWVAMEYLPRIVPHRSRARRSGAGPLQTLDHHNAEALDLSYPWRCIGKVFTGDDAGWTGGGTGVLVGPNLMMTASHVWPWGVPGRWMLFSPGFREGRQHPDSFVTRVRGVRVGDDDDPSGYDYVICQLAKPLGEMLGWMGSQSFGDEDDYYGGRWISVGYPTWFFNGMRPALELGIDIDDIDDDDPGLELETNYGDASGGGWSGGPLWNFIDGDPRIIGIKSGFEVDLYDPARGVFAGGNLMVELVKHGLANFR